MATKQRIPGTTVNLKEKAYGMGRSNTALNGLYGGMSGFTPDLANFINYTPYLRRNTVPVLVEAPRGFLDVAGGQECIGILKALLETGYKSFEGLNQTLESQFVGTEVGGDGNVMEVISDMKFTQSAPSFAFVEREGRPIGTFIDWWRTDYGMDPASKTPNIITKGVSPPDMLPDYYSATMLFFEPTKNWKQIDKAWLCFNMFPKGGANIEGGRDLTRAGELVEFNVEFTCMQEINEGVIRFAQSILETFSLYGASSFKKNSAWTAVDANVTSKDTGFNDNLRKQTANAVN
jgi:hypothetical protein